MESEVTHKLRIGDVFLEKDGWGKVCTQVGLSTKEVGYFGYMKEHVLASAIDTARPIVKLEIGENWVFLFNVCDMFKAAKGALHNDNSNP